MNPFLDNAKSQRIRSGVDTDSSADLISGHFLYGIAFILQQGQGLIAESKSFLLIISITDCNAVAINIQAAFL